MWAKQEAHGREKQGIERGTQRRRLSRVRKTSSLSQIVRKRLVPNLIANTTQGTDGEISRNNQKKHANEQSKAAEDSRKAKRGAVW
jgi:hypothetical protein